MKARSLRMLPGRGAVAVPGAFNAASALLVQKAGFEAVYISGAAVSGAQALPDTGLVTMAGLLEEASRMIRAVDIPAIVDIDTGFGGPAEAAAAVAAFEDAGAAAVQIEDQVFPKRCGHLAGKAVVAMEEFTEKIRAASAARRERAFSIIARTDARGPLGLQEAIRRANAYTAAGADVIFPEALGSMEEFREFAASVDAPLLANMTEFGNTPYITLDEFTEMGYSFVIFPVTAFRAAMKAAEEALRELKAKGTQRELIGRLQPREEFYRLIGYRPGDADG